MEELNRLFIKIPYRYGDTGYMWFVQEKEEQWTLISIGQEYELYREVGKRCALAEIGNLQLPPLGRVTMEYYLKLCEQSISESEATDKLYDYFNLEVRVSLEDFDCHRQKRLLEMIQTYNFVEVSPNTYSSINPDPATFSTGELGKEHIHLKYIGPALKQNILYKKQQSLF